MLAMSLRQSVRAATVDATMEGLGAKVAKLKALSGIASALESFPMEESDEADDQAPCGDPLCPNCNPKAGPQGNPANN